MGVIVIGLHNARENIDDIKKFVKDKGIDYPVVRDADDDLGSFGKTFRAYGVVAVPSVVVIDWEGRVAAYNDSADDAFQKVGELLAGQKGTGKWERGSWKSSGWIAMGREVVAGQIL